MLLPSKAQIVLFWGDEFTVLYNDAYRPVFGAKHPHALGLPGHRAWSEIWDSQLHELLAGVVRTGEAFWAKDLLFQLERYGFLEETYFDVSYDPVRIESGAVTTGRNIKALVPMSVIDEELEPTSLGSQVVGHRLSLPVGESSPVVRLHQVSYALRAHSDTGRAVAADRIAGVAGFAPTTFHALGSRVAAEESQGVNLVITNVPGPQFPMYLAGAEMVETYPVPPLQPGFGVAIGVTSYDGGVYYGITADRDALPDIDVFGQCVREALDELVDSASDSRPRAPRGRKK